MGGGAGVQGCAGYFYQLDFLRRKKITRECEGGEEEREGKDRGREERGRRSESGGTRVGKEARALPGSCPVSSHLSVVGRVPPQSLRLIFSLSKNNKEYINHKCGIK